MRWCRGELRVGSCAGSSWRPWSFTRRCGLGGYASRPLARLLRCFDANRRRVKSCAQQADRNALDGRDSVLSRRHRSTSGALVGERGRVVLALAEAKEALSSAHVPPSSPLTSRARGGQGLSARRRGCAQCSPRGPHRRFPRVRGGANRTRYLAYPKTSSIGGAGLVVQYIQRTRGNAREREIRERDEGIKAPVPDYVQNLTGGRTSGRTGEGGDAVGDGLGPATQT